LTVLGLNSIAVYVPSDLSAGFQLDAAQTHLWFEFGAVAHAYDPLLCGLPALAVFWLFFYWMCRRGIYLKL
jgi:predicted acyltransferase